VGGPRRKRGQKSAKRILAHYLRREWPAMSLMSVPHSPPVVPLDPKRWEQNGNKESLGFSFAGREKIVVLSRNFFATIGEASMFGW
jgi:hypothetical protein